MKQEPRFPRIVAETLAASPLVLPDSLGDDFAIVVLVFRRHAQSIVDSWIGPIAKRCVGEPRLSWYEIPMLAGGWRMISGFIDGGMRAGIPPQHHDHVATCYGDTARLRDSLGIEDLETAYVYLIDGRGRIHYHAAGWAHQRRLAELFRKLHEISGERLDV